MARQIENGVGRRVNAGKSILIYKGLFAIVGNLNNVKVSETNITPIYGINV